MSAVRPQKNPPLKFIDLFARIGGIRLGFERAASDLGVATEFVFASARQKRIYIVGTLSGQKPNLDFAESEPVPRWNDIKLKYGRQKG